MGMDLRTAPSKFILGDYVGAMDQDDQMTSEVVFGRVTEVTSADEIMVRTTEGELTGPWTRADLWHDPSHHVDYPHHPGTLYDCPACEVIMEDEEEDHE